MTESDTDKVRLWQGAVFGGIVSGLMCAKDEAYGRTHFWEGTAYVCDGLDGREGTIFFEGSWRSNQGWAFGLFFNPKSAVSPYNRSDYDLEKLIAGMPPRQRSVAEEAIQCRMFDEINGMPMPLVTAAIWSADGDRLITGVPWKEAYENGLDLIDKEFMGVNPDMIAKWQVDYGMPAELREIAVNLYHKRIVNLGTAIELERTEATVLREYAEDKSLGACQQYLSMMEIYVPH